MTFVEFIFLALGLGVAFLVGVVFAADRLKGALKLSLAQAVMQVFGGERQP